MTKENEFDLEAIRRAGEANMTPEQRKHAEEMWNATLSIIGGAKTDNKTVPNHTIQD
jgi:hypothetical protein